MKQTRQNQRGKATPQNEVEIRCVLSDVRIEKRSDDPDGATGRRISGYAATFDVWSDPIFGWFRERITEGAFDGCDMTDVIMCYDHNPAAILARTTSGTLTLSVDEKGLRFEFDAPATSCGNDMVELVRRGDVNKCSFKFLVESDSWVYADEENGLEYDERTITKFKALFDVSLVVYPAYNDTEVSVRNRRRKAPSCTSDKDRGRVESESRNRLIEVLRRVVG